MGAPDLCYRFGTPASGRMLLLGDAEAERLADAGVPIFRWTAAGWELT